MIINSEDFPALHIAADKASKNSQKWYLFLVKTDLGLIVFGALLSSFSPTVFFKPAFSITGFLFLLVGFIISILLMNLKLEKEWYGGRAVAESVKTLAWKYMTCSEPFGADLSLQQADGKFIENLKAILAERKYLAYAFAGNDSMKHEVTAKMREVRNKNLEERKELYVNGRIEDQRSWYNSKAQYNKKREKAWFLAFIGTQFLAIVSAGLLMRWDAVPVNPVGFFSALAAAFWAWMQVKEFQGLSQAYSVATYELGLIQVQAQHIKNENEFSIFVSDAENAVSREHTLWVARRDK